MMSAKKNFWSILNPIFFITILIFFTSMTTGGKKEGEEIRPEFVELQEGQGNYEGTIVDNGIETKAYEISFTGQTSLGNLNKETEGDHSLNTIDFAGTKEIEIVNPDFSSTKYSDADVFLVKCTMNNGAVVDQLLIPRRVIICAKEKGTNIKKAWFMRQLKKIIIDKRTEPAKIALADESLEQKGFFNKIFGGIKLFAQKLDPTK
jgi:hypothetical protein